MNIFRQVGYLDLARRIVLDHFCHSRTFLHQIWYQYPEYQSNCEGGLEQCQNHGKKPTFRACYLLIELNYGFENVRY